MKKVERVYNTISNTIEKVLVYFIGISATICLAIANIAVLSRYVLKYSLPWSEELLRILFIIIIYVGTALAYRSDALIGITMFEESLIGKANNIPYKIVKVFQHIVIIIFALIGLIQANNMM